MRLNFIDGRLSNEQCCAANKIFFFGQHIKIQEIKGNKKSVYYRGLLYFFRVGNSSKEQVLASRRHSQHKIHLEILSSM